MTEPAQPLDLAPIQARLDAAAPGPWDEDWRPIPGVPGYEVSDHGHVRSHLKAGNHKRKHSEHPRLLRMNIRKHDSRVTVSLPREDGKYVTRHVHRLVMLAFIGRCPDGLEVAHLNGNPIDNRLANLKYVTHQENEAHKRQHGTVATGERNGAAALLGWQVAEMKYLAAKGIPQARIADLFDVDRQRVCDVLGQKTWAEVEARQDVPALIAEVLRLRAIVRVVQAELASESRAHNQTIADRDDAQSMADKLAAAIAPPEVRGEHSGMNDPWKNALDYAVGRLS